MAGRELGILVTGVAMFSSTMSGFGFVGGPGLVYALGLSSVWIVITISVATPTADRMKYIILLDEGKFGLAADSITQVLTLEADDVRWRSDAGRRPWLAGTISERLFALLDTDVLARILAEGA